MARLYETKVAAAVYVSWLFIRDAGLQMVYHDVEKTFY